MRQLLGSLRGRLFVVLLAMTALTALAVGGATYLSVRRETDALFDYQLQQMSLSLRDQGRLDDGDRAAFDNPELDFLVQIWSLDGLSIYSSHPRRVHHVPARAVLGFSDQTIGGEPWRVYSAATPLRVVQVAQPLAARERLAARAAWRSVLPVAAVVPLIGLGLWAVLGRSLRPLQRVREAAVARRAGSQQPLPVADLPTEMQPVVEAFNDLLRRLDHALEAQRAFVADAAHELRTPLTALKLQVGLLAGARDEAERAAGLAQLRAGVDRGTRLVTQLMALARAEPDAQAAPLVPVDLVPVLRAAVADAQPLLQARQATLQVELPSEAWVRGDAEALRGAARNLLDNALQHGAPPLALRLDAWVDGGWRLLVDDSGRGIAATERERVLQRFQRAGSPAEGSGLGLAIVQAVARRHGAQLQLADSPLGGLRVVLTFASSSANPALTTAA